MFILGYKEDLSFDGFSRNRKGTKSESPPLSILIDRGLWSYLRSLGNFRISNTTILEKNKLYTLEDKDCFESIDLEQETPSPSKADIIEEQNANLIKDSLQKDIKIKNLNMSLAQTTLNLINKDIEVKDLNTNLANTTLNLVSKDIEVKDIQKDIANLILQSLGGEQYEQLVFCYGKKIF